MSFKKLFRLSLCVALSIQFFQAVPRANAVPSESKGYNFSFPEIQLPFMRDAASPISSKIVPVEFHFKYKLSHLDSAVAVLGTFNYWANPTINPAAKYDLMEDPDINNLWTKTLSLVVGYYEYKFVTLNSTHPAVSEVYPNVIDWYADPDNPLRVGTHGNSPLWVTSPMVYYLLPLDGSEIGNNQPTITAKISTATQTTIIVDSICIEIDGSEVLNSPSYYDSVSRSIEYHVESPLSRGEHTAVVSVSNSDGDFAADTTTFTVTTLPLAVPVTFVLDTYSPNFKVAEEVNVVRVAGDFNGWSPSLNYLSDSDSDGVWTTPIKLLPGKSYQYKFVVNSDWFLDPDNPHIALNPEGSEYNSVVTPVINLKPRITNLSPLNGSIFYLPVDSIHFSAVAIRGDSSIDLDPSSVVVKLDGLEVTSIITPTDSTIAIDYTATGLSQGLHEVTFDIADMHGMQADQASIAFGGYPSGTGFHYVDGFNDDKGNGNYVYPQGITNCCDIRAVNITTTSNNDSLHFEIELADITEHTKLGLQISNSTWDIRKEVLPQVDLEAPDWNSRGVHLNIISPTSPAFDSTTDNLLYVSRDPLMMGDMISVNEDAEATDKFVFNIALADLENIMSTYDKTIWYYSIYAYVMLPAGEFELSSQEGGIDALEDPDIYDVAFMPDIGIQNRILSNYIAADDVGGPRLVAIGPSNRGMRGIFASEIDTTLGRGPRITIFSEGGRVYKDTLLIGGTISDTTVLTATVTLNESDTEIPITNGLFSTEIVLSEGENNLSVTAIDSAGDTTRSRTITFTWLRDHSPIVNIVTSVQDTNVTLDASGSSNPDPEALLYSWGVDPDNPEVVTLTNPNSATTNFIAPTTTGEYYFNLIVYDPDDTSHARTVIVVDSLGAHTVELNDHPKWVADAVIYEIYSRAFSSSGHLSEITARIPELKDLGVTCIWLTPINVGPSAHGYAIADYYDINPDLGTKDDFRELVNTLHENDMYLIMDLVINHSSIEHPFMQDALRYGEYSPYYNFYIWDEAGNYAYYYNWTTLPNLNYDNPEVRDYFIDVSKYWMENFDIDGYRCDVAWGIQERYPAFWQRWRQELKTLKPDILLLAEASSEDLILFDERFDSGYDWSLRTRLGNVIESSSTINWLNSLVEWYESGQYPPYALPFRFLENHDYTRFISIYGKEKSMIAAALYLTLPGLPLVYAGQEVGELTQRYYIDWSDPQNLRDYYKKLIMIRKTYPALRQGKFDRIPNSTSNDLYSYLRRAGNNVIVDINFADTTLTSTLDIPVDLLGLQDETQYYLNDVLNDITYPVHLGDLANYPVTVGPYGAQILVLADTALFIGIAEAEDNTPRIFAIYQNYPNPFNLTTLIKYQLPAESKLSLKVYNVAGQKVCTLVDERQKPGYYTIQWNGRDNNNRTVASGIYFCRLEAGNFNDTKKLILLR